MGHIADVLMITHTTMRVGCAVIVGMGLLTLMRIATRMMSIVTIRHADAFQGIH
jgi:hypothetical protein